MNRRKPKHDYDAIARFLVTAAPDLAIIVATAAQEQPEDYRKWLKGWRSHSADERALVQALRKAAP